ncbi:MAG: ATP synthase F1 subunit delta [Planctomycetes bacterium]|nr:ATP synthase F1 subunit delta [Planctomycetota bacterium]
MAKFEHGSIAIADSYARTLLELAESSGQSDEVAEDFAEFAKLLDSDAPFAQFMDSQAIDASDREKVLEKSFRGRMNDLLLSTIQVVNRKGRCELLSLIRERFRLALEESRNQVDVQVTSAVTLSEPLRERLREVTAKISGKEVHLIENVDPSILGGLVVRMGDEKIDASTIHQIKGLKMALAIRASDEIHSGRSFAELND